MRISTNQIYATATLNMQRNQTALYKLQNQMSTGRRVLTPEDDPVAAAQALNVTQSMAINAQQLGNQGTASDQLRLVDSQLSSLTEALQNARDLVVQAGGGALAASDRASIATDLEARLNEILGIANAQNGSGDYLFSGYQGATLPFAVNAAQAAVAPATTSPFAYYGDDGERLLQVGPSRQLAINVAGSEVFMSAKAGNGSFVSATGGNIGVTAAAGNLGTATAALDNSGLIRTQWTAALASSGQPLEIRFVDNAGVLSYQIADPSGGLTVPPVAYVSGAAISLVTAGGVNFGTQVTVADGATAPVAGDKFSISSSINQGTATAGAGTVLDAQTFAAAVNNAAAGQPLEIRFSVNAGVTTYGIYDPVSNTTTGPLPFTPGAAIPLVTAAPVDFGAQVVVAGQPANGDTFTVKPSANQSVFKTLQDLIGTLRAPVGSASMSKTEYAGALAAGLTNLDQSMANVSRVQTTVGTRLRELDSLTNTSSDLAIQYEDSWSKLVGLDYAKAISDFTLQQTYLEAAQKSFAQISGSSLFTYL